MARTRLGCTFCSSRRATRRIRAYVLPVPGPATTRSCVPVYAAMFNGVPDKLVFQGIASAPVYLSGRLLGTFGTDIAGYDALFKRGSVATTVPSHAFARDNFWIVGKDEAAGAADASRVAGSKLVLELLLFL